MTDQELPKEEAERRAREVAQRMLTTPKLKKPASQTSEKNPLRDKARNRTHRATQSVD